MRRRMVWAFALALAFNGLSWVYAGVERGRQEKVRQKAREMVRQLGVPPEAELLTFENEEHAFGFCHDRTAEFRLPGPPAPETWLLRMAQGHHLPRKSRYEYGFATDDVSRSVSYDPARKVYRLEDHR